MKLKTLALIAASSAMSMSAIAQTEYNLDIKNTAKLTYTSGSDNRTAESLEVVFKVDRKVIFNLSGGVNNDLDVSPGEKSTVAYTLTNNSNAPVDYVLSTPTEDNVTYYIDVNSTPADLTDDIKVVKGNNPTETNPISLLLSDGVTPPTVDIFVEVVTAAIAVDGDSTSFSLVAKAVEPSQFPLVDIDPTAEDEAWVQNTVQTVVDNSAPLAGNKGILRTESGTHSVRAAIITLIKSVLVLKDPITDLSTDINKKAKAIPGATVQYSLTVKNTGHAPATVELTDFLSTMFDKTGTIASVKINGSDPTGTQAPSLVADTSTTGFDQLLTVPNVTVIAVPSDDTPAEQNTVVTFEVVLK